MSETVIRIGGLGKEYRISGRVLPYRTLRDGIVNSVRMSWQRLLGGIRRTEKTPFWALRNISMEIKAGEVVGLIGKNGAGKSTLLKILSRITDPTTGYAEIHGRVGSLLEVGTGFHPELTGRENIFLNGAILGMKRAEIARKFDEIVAFAEVEKFLETPVKHYSSGMYLRLAFAVAAHFEPEVLLVDEVLAVGDLAFQRKCTGKMSEVARQGRTVIFVSHNMAALRHLCTSAVCLEGGEVVDRGAAEDVIRRYVSSSSTGALHSLTDIKDRKGQGDIRIESLRFEDANGVEMPGLVSGQPARIVLKVKSATTFRNVRVCAAVMDSYNQCITYLNSYFTGDDLDELPAGGELVCTIPRVHLAAGQYRLGLWVQSSSTLTQDRIPDAGTLDVVEGDFFGTGRAITTGFGVALMDYTWIARPPVDMEFAAASRHASASI